MAAQIRCGRISSVELVRAHLHKIEKHNPAVNAFTELLSAEALSCAANADLELQKGVHVGPLHGVPFTVKDAIDVRGTSCTAGTMGRKDAPPAAEDATLVRRLREAGGIPLGKTNLPDLLFAFETDNLLFGRTNNPYQLSRTPGGSSGGEAAAIASCFSPLGLGSDAAGSVRLPAHFCGIASIKPTSGRLPRTGHVPPFSSWVERLWQIGPMARWTEDLILAMQLLGKPDEQDWTALPVALMDGRDIKGARIAFFTDNGCARPSAQTTALIHSCAASLAERGANVEEATPPGMAEAYELELALLGADGAEGIDAYLAAAGSTQIHSLLENGFLRRMRSRRMHTAEFASIWLQWDAYRDGINRYFQRYDALLCPVYAGPALPHGASVNEEQFCAFGYTMAWNLSGNPAATVRCGGEDGLPLCVQVVTPHWQDLFALRLCRELEDAFGGWQEPIFS